MCVQVHACSSFRAIPLHQLHIRECLCLFKNTFLKWFLHDLSQQRGQEKSIHPSLFHSSSLFPQLSSHLPSTCSPYVCYLNATSSFFASFPLLWGLLYITSVRFWFDCTAVQQLYFAINTKFTSFSFHFCICKIANFQHILPPMPGMFMNGCEVKRATELWTLDLWAGFLLHIDSVRCLRMGWTSLARKVVDKKREWGMDMRGSAVVGRVEEEACCFKSKRNNREDEKSMEGSI